MTRRGRSPRPRPPGFLTDRRRSARTAAALAPGRPQPPRPRPCRENAAGRAARARTTPDLIETHDVLRLQPLGFLDHVELDALALRQSTESGGLNGRVMNEHVGAVILLDEAVALFLGEPLHRPCGA